VRTWLYRIATNACLTALARRARRVLPEDLSTTSEELAWLEPYPDRLLEGIPDAEPGPEARFDQLEATELAFVAAMQYLPPRQRAVLLMRDVLGFSVGEVADQLECSGASVNSALQRARVALRNHRLEESAGSWAGQSRAEVWEVARRYLEAWERADITALTALLTADARMAMPPDPRAFEGRASIVSYFESAIFSESPERRIRLALTTASRQPAIQHSTAQRLRSEGLPLTFIRSALARASFVL
jgi:RNA polymerase sigma-70 factor, ECF subfamily